MHARADRRLNRVRVLQAAATLAATRGLSFSMSDVAELAQVSRSTVHRAFAGKAELLDAVAIDGWERTLATVRNHRVRAERSVAPVTLRHFERAVLDVAEDFIRADAFIVGAQQIAGRTGGRHPARRDGGARALPALRRRRGRGGPAAPGGDRGTCWRS